MTAAIAAFVIYENNNNDATRRFRRAGWNF